MKFPIKTLVFVGLILLYFSENIYGYYRFKQYCANEGGLKVYEKLEKNVGWLAEDFSYASSISKIKHIKFARYFNKKSKSYYDIKYISGDRKKRKSYENSLYDKSSNVIYKIIVNRERVKSLNRLHKTSYSFVGIDNDKVFSQYDTFSYSFFNKDKTFLGAPSHESCEKGSFSFLEKIEKIFKD